MVKFVIFLGALILFFACTNKATTENNLVFDKLIGTWKLGEEEQFEQWTKMEDGSYYSRTFAVAGKDTNVMEEVKIISEGGKWNFITQVNGQNKGKAITFTSTVLMDTIVQFENPGHDFPRMVNYRLASNNVLQAFIAGTADTIYFNYSRVVGK